MKTTWCFNCGDEFDPTEVSDTEVPLCSDECSDEYWDDEGFARSYDGRE